MVGENDKPIVRECDDCPWFYSNGYTEECGCLFFGKECEKCKKFDSDVGGCFYSQKKLERLAYEFKKSCRHAQKIAEGYNPFFSKPKTEKTPIFRPHFGFEYKVVGHKTMFCKNYMPNRKGGHRHNHIYNACHRIVFRGKASRRLSDWSDKREFVEIFYTNLRLHPGYLSETLQRKWRKR